MKKILASTLIALSFSAFAETPLENLDNLPAEIFLPEGATLVEGADDGTGGIDLTVTAGGKPADIVAAIEADAKTKGLVELAKEADEESAKVEYGKLGANNDPEAPEVRITYNILEEDGKTQVEILYLK